MYIAFADDSRQKNPSRPGMNQLVGIGGILVPSEKAANLEKEIGEICRSFGFPYGEAFKWSPSPDMWMRDNLTGEMRTEFFRSVLELLYRSEVKAIVVAEDITSNTATGSANHELDATILFLERVHNFLSKKNSFGIVVVDRPGGDRRDEEKFLLSCLETLKSGTRYVRFFRISHIFSGASRLHRLLQAADLITACTLSFIAGHEAYTHDLFMDIKKLLGCSVDGSVGGRGLKIHPDRRYVNLYHWLLGDIYYWKMNVGVDLPMKGRPYFRGQNEF